MLPLQYPRRWLLAGALILAVILAAAILPWLAGPTPSVSHADKWIHGVTFLVLALWFTGQYARSHYIWIFVGLCAYGALIELGQALIPYRTAEWLDLGADAAGALAGIIVALLLTGGWSVYAERWLDERIG